MNVLAFQQLHAIDTETGLGSGRLTNPLPVTIVKGPQQGRGLAIWVECWRTTIHHFRVVHEATGDLILCPPDWLEDRLPPVKLAGRIANDDLSPSPGEPARTCETCVSYGANTAARGWCIRVAMMVNARDTCIAPSGDRWSPWVEQEENA